MVLCGSLFGISLFCFFTTAFFSGIGNNVLFVNERLSPGQFEYKFRTHYLTSDVADYIKMKENTITNFFNGWWSKVYNRFGQAILQLSDHLKDEHLVIDTFFTNTTWKGTLENFVLYFICDGRKYFGKWEINSHNDSSWYNVTILDLPRSSYKLLVQMMPPIKAIKDTKTINFWKLKESNNTFILDFGVNITGWLLLK